MFTSRYVCAPASCFTNIHLTMILSDSLMLNLYSQLGYSTGEFQLSFATHFSCGLWGCEQNACLQYVSQLYRNLISNNNWSVSTTCRKISEFFCFYLYSYLYIYRDITWYIDTLYFIQVIFTSEVVLLFLPSAIVLSFPVDVIFFVYPLWLPNNYDLSIELYII